MSGMSDFAFSAKMRDIVTRMVEETVDRIRPSDRYGTVDSINTTTGKCGVILNGETAPVLINMGALQPASTGLVVRVSGKTGDRYISDVFGPVSFSSLGVTELAGTPATPNSGKGYIYEKGDGQLYFLNDSGIEHLLSADPGWTYVQPAGVGDGRFTNSWVNFGSVYTSAAYKKIGNQVHLQGLVKNGTGSIFTLPPEYRPSAVKLMTVVTDLLSGSVNGTGVSGTTAASGTAQTDSDGTNPNPNLTATVSSHAHGLQNHDHTHAHAGPSHQHTVSSVGTAVMNNTATRVDISTTGTITQTNGSNGYISLDGISFFID